MSLESQGVLYGASLDIPYAVGSVAIPLCSAANTAAAAASSFCAAPAVSSDSVIGHHAAPTSTAAKAATSSRASASDASRRRGVSSGSISSVRRCTHHRYCYLRDGGALDDDAFYRWLHHQQGERTAATGQSSTDRRRDPEEKLRNGATVSDAHAEGGDDGLHHSPSLLYASLACVIFLLPNSFPHPRRVLRRPPFLIEDDTWAEHMMEVQLHFLPHLRIPPVTIVHQVLLERRTVPVPRPELVTTGASAEVREVLVPQLLAATFGKPKLPPVATNVAIERQPLSLPSHDPERFLNTSPNSLPSQGSTTASIAVVVAEKVDTLRLYHPSLHVLQHARRVWATAALPVVQELRDAFADRFHSSMAEHRVDKAEGEEKETAAAVEDLPMSVPFRFPWSLPYEEVVAEYAAQRASTAVAVLQAVLRGLKRERATMEETCRRALDHVAELASRVIPSELADAHRRCLKLHKKE